MSFESDQLKITIFRTLIIPSIVRRTIDSCSFCSSGIEYIASISYFFVSCYRGTPENNSIVNELIPVKRMAYRGGSATLYSVELTLLRFHPPPILSSPLHFAMPAHCPLSFLPRSNVLLHLLPFPSQPSQKRTGYLSSAASWSISDLGMWWMILLISRVLSTLPSQMLDKVTNGWNTRK